MFTLFSHCFAERLYLFTCKLCHLRPLEKRKQLDGSLTETFFLLAMHRNEHFSTQTNTDTLHAVCGFGGVQSLIKNSIHIYSTHDSSSSSLSSRIINCIFRRYSVCETFGQQTEKKESLAILKCGAVCGSWVNTAIGSQQLEFSMKTSNWQSFVAMTFLSLVRLSLADTKKISTVLLRLPWHCNTSRFAFSSKKFYDLRDARDRLGSLFFTYILNSPPLLIVPPFSWFCAETSTLNV